MNLDEQKYLEEPVKVLKLSEAIRIGARLRPQYTKGQYFRDGASCAFGAASEAMTGETDGFAANRLHDLCIEQSIAYCNKYSRTIAMDNDAGVTREVIADRLEALGY